jgi:hypothetical protein
MSSDDGMKMTIFASLGGSLKKDLLADLQVDDNDTGAGWLSLEQLEQELALSIITMPCECR